MNMRYRAPQKSGNVAVITHIAYAVEFVAPARFPAGQGVPLSNGGEATAAFCEGGHAFNVRMHATN